LTSSVGSRTAISALSADRTISTVWRLTWSIASYKQVTANQPVAFEHILRAAILSTPAIVGSLLSRAREFANSARTIRFKSNTGMLRVCATPADLPHARILDNAVPVLADHTYAVYRRRTKE
jgi:hypothetical protein